MRNETQTPESEKTMAKHRHFAVPGVNQGTITKLWHEYEEAYPWWRIPAVIEGRPEGTIRVGIRENGLLGACNSADLWPELSRNEDGITFGPRGGGWQFTITHAVAGALNRYAGSSRIA